MGCEQSLPRAACRPASEFQRWSVDRVLLQATHRSIGLESWLLNSFEEYLKCYLCLRTCVTYVSGPYTLPRGGELLATSLQLFSSKQLSPPPSGRGQGRGQ